eukprot:354050-Chlamydomonas_euryale.AAC.7
MSSYVYCFGAVSRLPNWSSETPPPHLKPRRAAGSSQKPGLQRSTPHWTHAPVHGARGGDSLCPIHAPLCRQPGWRGYEKKRGCAVRLTRGVAHLLAS